MSYQIRPTGKYFLLEFSGRVDRQEIINSYAAVLGMAEFKNDSHTVWDFTQSVLDLSIDDIQQITQSVIAASAKRSNNARAAFIVIEPSDKAILQTYITGTARFPVEFRIFDRIGAGEKWLMTGG